MLTVWDAIRCVLCGLRGHDEELDRTETRLSIRCVSCSYQSTGWDITPAARWSARLMRFRRRLAGE